MGDSYLNNPTHWRERAEETRVKAEQFGYSQDAKNRMLRIADEYDRLADHAAERVRADREMAEARHVRPTPASGHSNARSLVGESRD